MTYRTILSSSRQVRTEESQSDFLVWGSGKPTIVCDERGRLEQAFPCHGPYPLDDSRFSPPVSLD